MAKERVVKWKVKKVKGGRGKLKREGFFSPFHAVEKDNNDAIVLKSKSIINAYAWEGDDASRPNLHVLAISAVLNFFCFLNPH